MVGIFEVFGPQSKYGSDQRSGEILGTCVNYAAAFAPHKLKENPPMPATPCCCCFVMPAITEKPVYLPTNPEDKRTLRIFDVKSIENKASTYPDTKISMLIPSIQAQFRTFGKMYGIR
jgi:hypothetical protein